ncbi:SprB repeat-containing protein [Dokdonia sp. Hel_I_53]|uniref:SprB repeat-containing protein n=1 Tax=Dokdonia sp. Hel_I_53 TaxID=1566287 RepID=UPI00119FEB50|nr:SprB repeat-containing protein [Dokdonia sp. Hel_I_53]
MNLKKNYALMAALLFSTVSVGQNLYKVEYDLTLTSPFSGTEFTYVDYQIRFISTSTSGSFLYYRDGVETSASNTKTVDLIANLSFNPNRVEFSAQAAAVGSVPCEFRYTQQRDYNSNIDALIFLPTNNSCSRPTYNGVIPVMFKIKDLQELNTSNGNNILTSCEPRTIRLNHSNVGLSYRVDYQLGPNTSSWSSFLPYARRSSNFDIQGSDFPGINSNTPLRLRVSYDQSNSNQSQKILPLNYILCSPKIIGTPSVTNTSCNYSNDGEFTVTFDRPLDLDNGEQLTNIGVYSAGPDGVINTSDDIFTSASPPTAPYTGSTYTYPNPLPAGEYILSYQATNASSDELSDPFTITSPPSLAYTITATDISCFEENNGTITITIDPYYAGNTGSNPRYYYTINGGTPVTFDTLSTTISSLGEGVREIKVFDYKNCTERL